MAAMIDSPVVTGMRCSACGAGTLRRQMSNLTDYLTHDTFEIDRCDSCALLITQPLPTGDAIGRYYPSQYRGNRHGFTGSMRSALRRRAVESNFPRGYRGRLLDIGCGDGSFALHMQSRGWKVCATEIDPLTVERLCHSGIDARLSSSAAAEGFDQKFDAVTCWHVLEHVENPRHVAEWVHTHLLDDGIFQVTVPNVQSLQARLFGRGWIHLDVPRHRQHFGPGTLQSLLESAGFTIEGRTNIALEYDWLGIIQSTLNRFCSRPNVLFEQLIGQSSGASGPASIADKIISWVLMPPVALVSLPAIAIAALAGDGATLTLTCKAR